MPRPFGVALLAGWIGGGAAVFGFNTLWDRDAGKLRDSGGTPIIVFGLTLLAPFVVTVLFARAAASPQVEHTTRD